MNLKQTIALRALGLLKVPLLFSVCPTVLRLDDQVCEVKIPLNFWTQNHFKSMYFGTLAIGADASGGLLAMHHIRKKGNDITIIFKDFHAEFLKRPEGDVHFTCSSGGEIKKMIQMARKMKKRVNGTIIITATTPKLLGEEPVAKFSLTLSMKILKKGEKKGRI